MKSHFDEFTDKMRETRQRSASLEQNLAMEADVTSDTKIRNRIVISGDNSSAEVDKG